MRTAQWRTSGEKRFDLLFMTPSSQRPENSQKSGTIQFICNNKDHKKKIVRHLNGVVCGGRLTPLSRHRITCFSQRGGDANIRFQKKNSPYRRSLKLTPHPFLNRLATEIPECISTALTGVPRPSEQPVYANALCCR